MIGFQQLNKHQATTGELRSVYRSPDDGYPYHWVECGPSEASTAPGEKGAQTPVVMLHGIMASSVGYRFAAPLLQTKSYLVDMVGHGHDERFRTGYYEPTSDSMANWAIDLLEFLDLGQVHLVGHSLGGVVSYLVAKKRPDLLRSLTLVAPGFRIPWVGFLRHMFRRASGSVGARAMNDFWFRVYEKIQWRNVRMNDIERWSYVEPLKDPNRMDFMLQVASDVLAPVDRLAALKPLKVRTQLIWGKQDHMLRLSDADRIADALLVDAVHLFPKSGHCPMEDEPQLFVQALHGFWERVGG